MNTKRILVIFSNYSAVFLILITLTSLLFRATLYGKLPVSDGEPIGLGDVIDLLFYFSIISISALTLVQSIVLTLVKLYRPAIRTMFVTIICPSIFYLFHTNLIIK